MSPCPPPPLSLSLSSYCPLRHPARPGGGAIYRHATVLRHRALALLASVSLDPGPPSRRRQPPWQVSAAGAVVVGRALFRPVPTQGCAQFGTLAWTTMIPARRQWAGPSHRATWGSGALNFKPGSDGFPARANPGTPSSGHSPGPRLGWLTLNHAREPSPPRWGRGGEGLFPFHCKLLIYYVVRPTPSAHLAKVPPFTFFASTRHFCMTDFATLT